MEAQLAKIRAVRKRLGTCIDAVSDPSKIQQLHRIRSELLQMEQDLLFNDVLHLRPLKQKSFRHYTKTESDLRVMADQASDPAQIRAMVGTNTEKQQLVAELDIQREDSTRLANFNRLFAQVLNLPTISEDAIAQLVEQDNVIPTRMKATVTQELIHEASKI